MRTRVSAVVVLATVGCSGAQFEVSPSLRAASTAPVEGKRITCTAERTGVESITGRERFSMDGLTLALSQPLLTTTEVRPDVPADILASLEQLEEGLGVAARVGQTARAVTSVAAGAAADVAAEVAPQDARLKRLDRDLDRGLGGAVTVIGDARAFVGAVRDWLTLPTTSAQDATVAFAADKDGQRVYGVCRSTNAVAIGQTFSPSDFQLACQIAAEGDTAPHDLWLTAAGSGWVDYSFRGTLRRGDDPGWMVRSQSGRVLGAGFVRGFEVSRGERQDAAVSFLEDTTWDVDTTSTSATPRAWWSEQADRRQTLLLQTVLVLLTAHPLVGACDAAIITDRTIPASIKPDEG